MTRSTRRGPWLPEEDQTLLSLVRSQGPNNWVRISQHMLHRSPKQCRERYHQNLKPSLNHEPISAQEGELIEQMVREMGRHWAEIARRLGNRSDNAVKNWWNGSMNRRKRHNANGSNTLKTQVGHRTQPIPATRPPRPAFTEESLHASDFHRIHHMPQNWSRESHQARPLAPPIQYLDYNNTATQFPTYDPRILEADRNGQIMTPTSYTPVSEPMHNPINSYQHNQHPASSPIYFSNQLPPLLWHTSRPSQELALISPIGNEMSRAPSLGQAPSLVSDNQSTYSVSPKTVPSPRPNVLAPINTAATREWVENPDGRRSSAPTVREHGHSVPLHQDEGYVSAIGPASAVSEPKYHSSALERDMLRNPSPGQYPLAPPAHLSIPPRTFRPSELPSPSDMSPNSARDARMHVASILG